MIEGDRLVVLEEKTDKLDLNKNDIYKFLGCKQADKIVVKWVMERVKKGIRKGLGHLIELNLNGQNLMKAINCQVIPVCGHAMNVCNLGEGDWGELYMILKSVLWREGFHDEIETNAAYYMAAATSE